MGKLKNIIEKIPEETKHYLMGLATGAAIGVIAFNVILRPSETGFKRGEATATKNLVTAVQTIGREFRKEFNHGSRSYIKNDDALGCYIAGNSYLEAFERTFLENASGIANGKIKVEDTDTYKCFKQDYDNKIGELFHF